MKALFKEYFNVFLLIGLGVLFSSVSFIYRFAINYENTFLSIFLLIIDIGLLLVNFFYLSYLINEKVGKSIVNAIIFSLIYFVGITGMVLLLAKDNASVLLMMKILEILVYLGPSIIILLPFIYLFCLGLG